MLSRSEYLPVELLTEDYEINVFENLYGSDNESPSDTSFEESTIEEKLDTIIEYQSNIHYAIWSLIGFLAFIVVVRLLWTVFDKWFFGGV